MSKPNLRAVPNQPLLRVIDCADMAAIEAVLAVEYAELCIAGAGTDTRDAALDAYRLARKRAEGHYRTEEGAL